MSIRNDYEMDKKNMKITDIYFEQPKMRSVCKVCGDNTEHRQKKNPKYLVPYYFKAFVKEGWFRGDDTYLGRICKKCIREGREQELIN